MRYEFIVRDTVCSETALDLPELSPTPYPTGGTSWFGPVRDRAEIETLLARLESLGLTVIEMRRLPD